MEYYGVVFALQFVWRDTMMQKKVKTKVGKTMKSSSTPKQKASAPKSPQTTIEDAPKLGEETAPWMNFSE